MLAVTVNDRPIYATAIVERGRVLLPLRAAANALGATVWYDPRAHNVVVRHFSQQLRIRPRIIANRAYVPMRFLAQSFGAIVGYDAPQHLVRIVDPQLLAAAQQIAPAASFTTPPPLPPIAQTGEPPDYGYYGNGFQFNLYAEGRATFYQGDWMRFVLIAPPGGSASLRLCNLGYQYSLWNGGSGNTYRVSIPAPNGYWIPNCLVTATYTSWSGRTTYVPVPVYIGLFTAPGRPYRNPSPAPSPRVNPIPGGPHRPEPTPAPTIAPVPTPAPTAQPPQPTAAPHPVHTPPDSEFTPRPRPHPTP